MIKGGIEQPYVKVEGSSEDTSFVSGDSRYEISSATNQTETVNDEDIVYTYYYIAEDVVIAEYVDVTSISSEGRVYTSSISEGNDINILNNGTFSSDIGIDYNFDLSDEDDTDDNLYKNVTRSISIVNSDTSATERTIVIPKGTEILMIANNTCYSYVVSAEDVYEVKLSEFTDIDGNNFEEIEDIQTEAEASGGRVYNSTNKTATYNYSEEFKFIINFSNSTYLDNGTYYPIIDVYDDGSWIGSEKQNDNAENVVTVYDRSYEAKLQLDNTAYMQKGTINISGSIDLSELNYVTTDNRKRYIWRNKVIR